MGAPSWADGLACPFLSADELDPAQQARDLVSRSAASLARAGGARGGVSPLVVGVVDVDQVFALVQLALDERCVRACMLSTTAGNLVLRLDSLERWYHTPRVCSIFIARGVWRHISGRGGKSPSV